MRKMLLYVSFFLLIPAGGVLFSGGFYRALLMMGLSDGFATFGGGLCGVSLTFGIGIAILHFISEGRWPWDPEPEKKGDK